jgi:hypothetical protein
MSALDASIRARFAPGGSNAGRIPTMALVLGSRLLVLAAGTAATLLTKRVHLWSMFDPSHITSHLGTVGNVLAAPAVRWDSIHYLEIAQHGYVNSADTPFYPLYPLLIRALAEIVRSPAIAGVLISCVAFVVALTLLDRLTRDELGGEAARATVLLLAFAPLSFFFTAVYTESLFLALLVLSFYLARQGCFARAALAAAFATLTHVEGILLTAPLAYMYWRSRGRSLSPRALCSWAAASLALPGLALAGFCTYLHALGYGWLAPVSNANMSNYGRTMVGPPLMLWKAVSAAADGAWQTLHGDRAVAPTIAGPFDPGFQNIIYLAILGIALAALLATWRRLPREYAIFAALSLLVITSSAVVVRPLESFDRYTFAIFPLWMSAGAWLAERKLTWRVLSLSSLLLVFYAVEFSRWVFIA